MSVARYDLRHRLPFSFPNYDNVREIEDEIKSMSVEVRNHFDKIKLFFITYFKSLLNDDQLKIIEYMEGTTSLEQIGLTRDNAARYLQLVKIVDLALIWQTRISRTKLIFKNSTYEIRTRVLVLLSPEMQTTEAYTLAIDPKKIKNVDYLKNPANWIPERIGFYAASLIPQEYIQMISLSKRLSDKQPRVYALRGNTASGKTTLAKQRFKNALDENGEITGSLNPDTMKYTVKTKTTSLILLTNKQVHEEVVRGPLSSYKEAILCKPKYSVILDTRLSTNKDFNTGVVAAAKIRGGKATVIDIDAPLNLSMMRVLTTRTPTGKSPCVPPSSIIEGFKEMRRCRFGIIEQVKNEPVIDRYELIHIDGQGNLHLVAAKTDFVFQVFSETLLERCLRMDNVQELVSEVVTIEPWQNIPLNKALEYHSSGISPQEAKKRKQNEAGPT